MPTDAIFAGSAGCNFRSFSIVLSDGAPRAIVMLTARNRDRNQAFLGAKESANRAGIPFINFYNHLPNEPQYVVNRLKSFGL